MGAVMATLTSAGDRTVGRTRATDLAAAVDGEAERTASTPPHRTRPGLSPRPGTAVSFCLNRH